MLLLRICQKFRNEKIPYLVVGGYAVALHGAVRGTVDIDLTIELSEKTFIQTENVLKDLGLISRLPVTGIQVFQFRDEYIKNRNLIAWSFYNPKNSAEQVDIIINQDAKKLKGTTVHIRNIPVQIATIDTLIKLKEQSARPQDLEDIKALKKLKGKNET